MIKCFNEEVKATNKNRKVNGSAVCFLYNIFFQYYFYNQKFILFQSTVFFGKKWVALKRAGCWVTLKRTGCWMVWKMVPQTTSHASFKMTTGCLNTSFESCSPQVNYPPRSARTHAMSQPAAVANWLFCILLGSTVTLLRWSGQICSQLVSVFLRSLHTESYWNRFIFDWVIPKIKSDTFFGKQCIFVSGLV